MSTVLAFIVSWVVLGALVGWMFGGAARLGGDDDDRG